MKTLKEALFNKKNLNSKISTYGIIQDDMIDDLEDFPVGVVVRMMEEQELQGNEPDVKVFQEDNTVDKKHGGFDWNKTEAGFDFWDNVFYCNDFDLFFEKYPNYKRY